MDTMGRIRAEIERIAAAHELATAATEAEPGVMSKKDARDSFLANIGGTAEQIREQLIDGDIGEARDDLLSLLAWGVALLEDLDAAEVSP
jgi:hypothetical protein